jgi:hypothetical protein
LNFCSSNFSCTGIGETAIVSLLSLSPGTTVNVTVFANVSCTIPQGGAQVVNTVRVESLTPDPNGSNNTRVVSNQGVPGPPSTIAPTGQSFSTTGGDASVFVSGPNCSWSAISNAPWITITSSSSCCNGFVNYNVAANSGIPRTGTMTIAENTFTVMQDGTLPAPGTSTTGLQNPVASSFFLRNSNSTGVADTSFSFGPGSAGWLPLVGDWDGDGVDTVGVFNPGASTFFLRNSNSTGIADISFAYGPAGAGWSPIVGDWDGNGTDTVGLYNPVAGTFFLRNSNTTGVADISFAFGPGGAGWIPLVGDWNNDATDTIGLYNPSASTFFLRNGNSTGVADVAFAYGPAGAGWRPLVGDWDGDGTDTIGLYNPAASTFFLRNSNTTGVADLSFAFGPGGLGWIPLAGDWDGL